MPAASVTTIDDSLDLVCKELDQLALTYLYKLNRYTQARTITTSELQKGFLGLAHAKYTMGAKTISHFSYDERMKAQVQLKVDYSAKSPYTMTHIPSETLEPSTKTKGLRQRIEKESEWMQKDPDDVAENEEFEMDEKKPLKKGRRIIKAIGNPLHWFGLLVSPSLRTSQDHFQTATTHLIDLANMIHDLQIMEQQYQALQDKKDHLIRQRMNKDTAVGTVLESTTTAVD
ncbi:hypothetical protein BCR42DRAFT_425833 [Absidia repens]|uniref:Vacuolar ATPase assembly protein VMA22 n=1 Tax=Absidia repens TaxID=90262 RepID=A0A1X2I1U0_9FUNG|nr:hypothetical protein BCR42DRAFT_425833 [Absidia repens]